MYAYFFRLLFAWTLYGTFEPGSLALAKGKHFPFFHSIAYSQIVLKIRWESWCKVICHHIMSCSKSETNNSQRNCIKRLNYACTSVAASAVIMCYKCTISSFNSMQEISARNCFSWNGLALPTQIPVTYYIKLIESRDKIMNCVVCTN